MKAAVITASRTMEVVNTRLPHLAHNEVRIRLEGSGICASNLPVWEGREWFQYPLRPGEPGHEGWGIVDAAGDSVDDVRVGTRVAFLSTRAYAEYDIAQSDAVVPLPAALNDHKFPGEALGCAMNIFRRSEIERDHTVVVIGAGFLGNLLIQLAKSVGARVIAISRRESALELAHAFGADATIPMRDHWKIVSQVKDLTNQLGAERVIECIGSQWPLDIANDIIAERGRLIIAGYHQDGPRQIHMQHWNWLGIDVVNAHERDPRNYVRGMREAVDAVLDGRINPAPLLTHSYKLDELGRALSDVAERPGAFVKGTVLFS